MSSIHTYLSQDHEHCDQLFADSEEAVSRQDWDAASSIFDGFKEATLQHFVREEEILFPAFDASTGMSGGPTYVMRLEHDQMRDTLQAMADALEHHDSDSYLGLSETMLMLMRQHNLKEEQILYPMCDRALAAEAETLLARMGMRQD